MDITDLRRQLRRRAIIMEIGGFRPSMNLKASWFGSVNLALPHETWPTTNEKFLLPLCQINLKELLFRPPRLEDLELITVFINPEELPDDDPNGVNWCLRAYRDISQLVSIKQPFQKSPIKAFPMKPKTCHIDFPCWEDVNIKLPNEIEEQYIELFENHEGFKLGGWPTLIQSEISWASWNQHLINPEYVFQIDSSEKANWEWGDGGVGYFGRGTTPDHLDEWALAWQCL